MEYLEHLAIRDSFQPGISPSTESVIIRIIGRLEDFASTVHNGLEEADWARKRELIRALVKRVEVAPNEVNVVFRIDPHPEVSNPEKKSLQLCRGSTKSYTIQHLHGQARQVC